MLYSWFGSYLFYTISSDAQVEITFDGEIEVGQLNACTAIVKDQVLN